MNALQEIFALYAQAAEITIKANKLGQDYTDKNSPFKSGDKVIFKESYKELCGIVQRVFFDQHSTLPGMAKLQIQVWNNGFASVAKNRNFVFISSKNLLVKHLENLNQ